MMRTKRTRDSDRSKQEILQAAEHQFGEKGFYGARIDEIARLSGLNKNMIYHYFDSKENLYLTVLADMYRRLEEQEQYIISRNLHGQQLIQALISSYFDFLSANPYFVSLLMNENLLQGKFMKQLPRSQVQRKTLDGIAQLIQESCDSGVFRRDIDVKQTVLTLNAICFSNFSNRYTFSQLIGYEMDNKIMALRKQQTIDIMLSYLMKS